MPNPSSYNLNKELNTAKQVQPKNVGAGGLATMWEADLADVDVDVNLPTILNAVSFQRMAFPTKL